MKEARKIKKLSKKVIPKKKYRKIRKIKNKKERLDALKYLTACNLELKYYDFESKINKMKGENKNTFFAELKLVNLPAKIKFFKMTTNSSDLASIIKTLNEIKKELKNV